MASRNNRPLPNEEYTVGWICALANELTAARAFLDNIHSDRPHRRATNDNNTYLLGDIEGHNVVVAGLPAGVYGTSSAASVARDLLRSFENVRIGLMVGIGGGAPSPRNNIHLGDVIVSVPHNGSSGVFQYDFGKTIQDQNFQYTGHLDKPPTILLGAIASLNARSDLHGNGIADCIEVVLNKYPRLRRYFGRPEAASDQLYVAQFTHRSSDDVSMLHQGCESTCGTLFIVDRGASSGWTERFDEPTVFQGIIASANQLMKHALVRDALSQKHDVLCFEMEAAGLMNNFPCLVVRGICDYSDTHKNDAWQGYAALSAAAYTKQLLGMIAPSSIQSVQKLVDHFNAIMSSLDTVRDITSQTQTRLFDMDVVQTHARLKEWLSPFDASTYHIKALTQHMAGSCEWLIQSLRFRHWRDQPSSFLWLSGLPGCGKTVLSSTIIERLSMTGVCLYFYITFLEQETLSLDSLLRSLIWQSCHKYGTSTSILLELHKRCSDRQLGDRLVKVQDLIDTFADILRLGQETYVVIDALDECLTEGTRENARNLISWIKNISSSGHKNLHLLVTSRKEDEIRAGLEGIAGSEESVEIVGNGLDADIKNYVQARISGSEELQRWKDEPDIEKEIRDSIQAKLVNTADGMFRYVACQIEELEKCLSLGTLREALKNLPKDINDTYSRIMKRVLDKYRLAAIRILQFLTYSGRPLRVEELIDAVAVQPGRFSAEHRIRKPIELVRYCSCLVKLVDTQRSAGNEMKMELHLAHFTVREYLRLHSEYAPKFTEVAAKASIALASISYLRYIDRELRHPESTKAELEVRFPWMRYCSKSWILHAAVAVDHDKAVFEETMGFLLQTETKYFKGRSITTRRDGWNRFESPLLEAFKAGLSTACLKYILKQDRYKDMLQRQCCGKRQRKDAFMPENHL